MKSLARIRRLLFSTPRLERVRLKMRAFHADQILSFLSHWMCRPLLPTSGRAMVISPHPDDETFGCGGLIALKRQRGVSVQVVFLTNGENSALPMDDSITRQNLPGVRIDEARAATGSLGVPESDLHFLGLPDSALKELSEERRREVVKRLCQLMITNQTTEVYVTHWDDCHGDHEAAYVFAVEAIQRTYRNIDLLQYLIWKPWLHPLFRPSFQRELRGAYRLSIDAVQREKNAAIRAYASQIATLPHGFLRRFYGPYELFFNSTREPAHREQGR